MISFNSLGRYIEAPCYIAFDSEWTKNFRVKNGNRPFCFSAVALAASRRVTENMSFQVAYAYVDVESDAQLLVAEADRVLRQVLAQKHHVLVGHQLSSDLAALMNFCPETTWVGLRGARSAWRERKHMFGLQRVVDTRYDLERLLRNKSRRLVDVCNELRLGVTQPELGSSSMTALQRKFLSSRDEEIRQRLQVMNIRHSLSCGVLAMLGDRIPVYGSPLNLNRVLYKNLRSQFDYVGSDDFKRLL